MINYDRVLDKLADIVLSEKRDGEIMVLYQGINSDGVKRICTSFRESKNAEAVYFCKSLRINIPPFNPNTHFVMQTVNGNIIVYTLDRAKEVLKNVFKFPLLALNRDVRLKHFRDLVTPANGEEVLLMPPDMGEEFARQLANSGLGRTLNGRFYSLGDLVVVRLKSGGEDQPGRIRVIDPLLGETVLTPSDVDKIVDVMERHLVERYKNLLNVMKKTVRTLNKLVQEEMGNELK